MSKNYDGLYKALGYGNTVPQANVDGNEESFGGMAWAELPPLGPDEIAQLEQHMIENPKEVVDWYTAAWGDDVTEDDIWDAISEAKMAFDAPQEAADSLESLEGFHRKAIPLPDGFTFPGMDLNEIPINPGIKKFETKGDALGWMLFSGPQFIGDKLNALERAPFRWHNDFDSNFLYDLKPPSPNSDINVALLSDFGTGLYHSLYIGKQLQQRKFDYAFHCGDVYYSGRTSEFLTNFEAPLNPILDDTAVYTMNANHEMLSGGIPYFNYIDRRRRKPNQKQEGSYFATRGNGFQIIGIDTAYFNEGRLGDKRLVEWLHRMLLDGKNAGCINILLSPNEPYSYGKRGATHLFIHDVEPMTKAKLIDMWFWGNTHYCALFDPTDRFPFVGSCIGHGGYPYTRLKKFKTSAAPVRFLEDKARFPAWTGLRQDRGNNGYATLKLKNDGNIDLVFVDWMSNERCIVGLSRTAGDGVKIDTVQENE